VRRGTGTQHVVASGYGARRQPRSSYAAVRVGHRPAHWLTKTVPSRCCHLTLAVIWCNDTVVAAHVLRVGGVPARPAQVMPRRCRRQALP
jgi:hypothetical protein